MPLSDLEEQGYQIEFHSHAEAILTVDFPEALTELADVLRDLTIPIESLVKGGGGETTTTQGLRRALAARHWKKHNFTIKKLVDGEERESISHEIDHVRTMDNGKVAMEIEWNNKDPFFDRDLDNFKRLHAEAAISVGIILTRGRTLHRNMRDLILRFATENSIDSYADLIPFGIDPTARQRREVMQRVNERRSFAESWSDFFVGDKYGQAGTHWDKLEVRVHRGVGNPCPLLLIGIPDSVITFE